MKNLILTFFCLLLFSISTHAQDFDSAVGLRIGFPVSATFKKFISENNALEAYGGFRNRLGTQSLSLHGAFLIHKDIDEVENLQYYYGGGGAVFFFTSDFSGSATTLGIQGYIGLSYTLKDSPINVSADWIPTLLVNDGLGSFGRGFGGSYGSVAVRYILGGEF